MKKKVRDQAERGDDDADGPRQEVAAEHPNSGEQHDQPDDQVYPTPEQPTASAVAIVRLHTHRVITYFG